MKPLLHVQFTDPDEAWREYIFRVLLIMMGVTLGGFLLLISIGWIAGIFDLYSVWIMLALNISLGFAYWLVERGMWRRARNTPIAIFYLMGVYGSYMIGIATNLEFFYVLVIFLTAVLFDRRLQFLMLLLCLTAPIVMELIFGPLGIVQTDSLEPLMPASITLGGLLVGLSLLVGFVVQREQAALMKANTSAQELRSEMKERHQTVKALAESEAKYRNVIESIPIGMHMYRLEKDGKPNISQ